MPFHMSSLSLKSVHVIRKNARKAELYYKMYCIFPHLVFFCKNAASYLREYLVFTAISLKKLNLSKKRSYKTNERKDELHY